MCLAGLLVGRGGGGEVGHGRRDGVQVQRIQPQVASVALETIMAKVPFTAQHCYSAIL